MLYVSFFVLLFSPLAVGFTICNIKAPSAVRFAIVPSRVYSARDSSENGFQEQPLLSGGKTTPLRRAILGQLASLAALTGSGPGPAGASPTSAGRRDCIEDSDPGKTVVICTGDVMSPNASRPSRISATENGISSSSVNNPSRFSPPWTYLTETDDPRRAWNSLVRAIMEGSEPGTAIVELTDSYVHATVPTVFPKLGPKAVDDLEFVLRKEDNLVLYRSASRASVFVYPLTQPVSDRNSNLQRLQRIRSILGWEELGYAQTGSKML